jgi:cobalamin-dependent methionine synthase I
LLRGLPLGAGRFFWRTVLGWFEPKAVYGYLACQAEGNDVVLYDSPNAGKTIQRFTFPRRRESRKLSIADFFLRSPQGKYFVA